MAAGTETSERDVTQPASPPRSVSAFTALLAGLAVASAAIDFALFGSRAMNEAWLPIFALVLCAGALFQIRFRYRDEIEALDLFEAVLMPVLFAYSGWIVVALVILSNAVAEALRRNTPLKAAFNVVQWAAAAGVGALAYSALRDGNSLDAHNVGALAVSVVVVLIINHLAFATVVALAQRYSLGSVLGGLRSVIVPGWIIGGGLNLAFGLLFVAAYQWSAAVLPLFFVPLAALNWASAAFAAARADEVRLQALHRGSALLGGHVDPLDAIDEFLGEGRSCFGAEAAELVLLDGDRRTVRRAPAVATPVPAALVTSLLSLAEPARLTAQSGTPQAWRDCLAAPLVDDGQTVGVLCTYNRTGLEGFEDGELAVLAALADDVVTALQRGALVQRVVDERQKLRDIVGKASDGIFTMSLDGVVTSWNPAMEETTGHGSADMVGRAGFGILRPRDIDGCDVILEQWATTGDALPGDLQILTMSGERRWLSCSYSRAVEPEGTGEWLVVIARDVTKVREVERLREDFVATVSHELRTPLSPIKGWASTLLQFGDTLDPDERRAALQSILRQSQRLERLIVNLLEVSKIEHGMLEAADADVDVAGVVRRIVDDFEKTSPNRTFTVHASRMFCARAKELWVEQIVTNLISNAVKYSPDAAPVEVTIGGADGRIQIAVTDHGCGIPAHELDRVFQRFHRVRETMTQTGTGLGLYIARQLADEMDGAISVESMPGRGSTFVLDLPAVPRLLDVRSPAGMINLEAG
jgi:PAS domain S-box-containing protein